MPEQDLRAIIPGASALIKALCDELEMAQVIDAAVRWDPRQCKLSPGTRIVALVVNALVHREPLYHVEAFYAGQDVALLFGPGVQAGDFNDDALARALDALAEANPSALFSQIALNAVLRDGIAVRTVHADTTSRSVYGAYEGYPEKPLHITHGHSKQHRPDLKQMVFGILAQAQGLPVAAGVHDGNQSDKVWNGWVLDQYERLLAGHHRESLLYVADCQFVTQENLARAQAKKVRFISRLPASFALEAKVKQQAALAWPSKANWQYVGSLAQRAKAETYWVWETQAELYGRTYRLVVVRPSRPDPRSVRALERRIDQEAQQLAKACRRLSRQCFACEADARSAAERFLSEQAPLFHTLHVQVVAHTHTHRPRGRPRRDGAGVASETVWHLAAQVQEPTAEQRQAWTEAQAYFVLITNVPSDALPAAEVLREYKGQVSVERCFSFLKDPVIVDGIYLKRPERAYALGFVFLLALLVAAFLEQRIRRELARTQDVLELPGRRKTATPTVQAILDLFRSLQIVLVDTGQRIERILPRNTSPQILKVLRLAGYSERLYLGR